MAEFTLPPGSRIDKHGKELKAPADAKQPLKFRIYRYDPEGGGKPRIDYRPVKLQPMTNDVQSFPPKARVY